MGSHFLFHLLEILVEPGIVQLPQNLEIKEPIAESRFRIILELAGQGLHAFDIRMMGYPIDDQSACGAGALLGIGAQSLERLLSGSSRFAGSFEPKRINASWNW